MLVRQFTKQQAEFFQTDAHGDWRNKELLSERPGNAVEGVVDSFRPIMIAKLPLSERDLHEGMPDRDARLDDALFAVREHLVPRGEHQLARHQKAGRREVRLPLDRLLGLTGPADDRRRHRTRQQVGLRPGWR